MWNPCIISTSFLAFSASTFAIAPPLPPYRRNAHAHSPSYDSGSNSTSCPPGNFTTAELWALNERFWTSFISPNNQAQANSINSTLFAEDILGRIDATRDFDGRELNTEYVYGLFSQLALNPGSFSLIGIPLNYTVTQFLASEYAVSTTVLLDFSFPSVATVYPIEIGVWFTYNSRGEISQYDATFLRYLDWQFADMFARGMRLANVSDPAVFQRFVTGQLVQSVCKTHQTYCNGTNLQYASNDECVAFLGNGSVPLGTPYQLGMNTVACRSLHQAMVPYRPDVHCAHLGPKGGGYCTDDRDYSTYLNTNHFTKESFVLSG